MTNVLYTQNFDNQEMSLMVDEANKIYEQSSGRTRTRTLKVTHICLQHCISILDSLKSISNNNK